MPSVSSPEAIARFTTSDGSLHIQGLSRPVYVCTVTCVPALVPTSYTYIRHNTVQPRALAAQPFIGYSASTLGVWRARIMRNDKVTQITDLVTYREGRKR
jgi:hypothetical protein